MYYRTFPHRIFTLVLLATLPLGYASGALRAQSNDAPLTNRELVRLVYQLPAHPEKKDEVIGEIRRRGIGFPLTDGLRSLVATKSGSDPALRRTLEEAERRRLNPVASALPSEAEAQELLAKSKTVTLAAADAMPDFIVKQLITRSIAYANTNNWQVSDRLTIAVSYRASAGEEYKLLAVNGIPATTADAQSKPSYEQVGGAISTGEYVSMLASLFKDGSRTTFKPVDTDTLRGHRTIVYEFAVKKEFSKQSIKAEGAGDAIITGHYGKIWIDRETFRVLRIENTATATDIPADFPIRAAGKTVDYDWVSIADHKYLLPSMAEVKLTANFGRQNEQSRQTLNVIRFRGYQKFGTEVIINDDITGEEIEGGKPQN